MGIYVNPGNEEFKRAANSKIYVDKTMLLAFTNQNLKSEHQNICVSRPRRFGKSMAANMLVAYYGKGDDSYELFEPFKFAKDPDFKKHLNQYNAIHLNMQQFLGRTESVEDMMELISRKVVRELKREFPQVTYYEEDLVSVLEEIYSQTRSYFVFVMGLYFPGEPDGCAGAEKVSQLSQGFAEKSALLCACLHDRHPSHQKIRRTFRPEHV